MSKGTWIMLAVLLTAGCGGSDQTGTTIGPVATTTAPSPLAGTTWLTGPVLASDGKPISDTIAHVTFTADGKAEGSDGCNGLGGNYTLDGDRLTAEVDSTVMACLPSSHCTETGHSAECQAALDAATEAGGKFFNGLNAAERYRIEGDTLTLLDADGNVLLELTRSE